MGCAFSRCVPAAIPRPHRLCLAEPARRCWRRRTGGWQRLPVAAVGAACWPQSGQSGSCAAAGPEGRLVSISVGSDAKQRRDMLSKRLAESLLFQKTGVRGLHSQIALCDRTQVRLQRVVLAKKIKLH